MADQNNKWAIPMWAIIAVSIILTILFIKFCTNNGKTKVDTAPIKQTHVEDSIKMAQAGERHRQAAQALLLRAQQAERKYAKADSSLKSIIEQNKRLIKNRLPLPPVDTNGSGITAVPQEFIDDCAGCFTQLAKTTDSAITYQQEVHALHTVMQAQNQADSQRIAQLEADKLRLNKDYNDMRLANEVNSKYMEPRRKIKTGLAVPFTNSFLPNGVGAGIMYQDKKDRNFGIEALFGRQQPMYVARMYVPLYEIKN